MERHNAQKRVERALSVGPVAGLVKVKNHKSPSDDPGAGGRVVRIPSRKSSRNSRLGSVSGAQPGEVLGQALLD
jgi:hypothetical protein